MTSLGRPPVSVDAFGPVAVSGDGSVIVGETFLYAPEGWRWEEGEFEMLCTMCWVNDMSADGTVTVGISYQQEQPQAFAWSAATGMTLLGTLGGGNGGSSAWAISADGTTIVGASSGRAGVEAFHWTEQTGMVGLGDLPGGSLSSAAKAVSGDGTVVAGLSEAEIGLDEAFRWTAFTGMVNLGDTPIPLTGNIAPIDVSSDGSVIIGNIASVPFIWDADHGIRLLQEALIDAGIEAAADWYLIKVNEISADGTRIVGEGRNPRGEYEGWLAILPRTVPACDGDLDDDGEVNGVDLAMLLAAWGACSRGGACDADLNGDGAVSGVDLALQLGAWGACR
jgi:probable HAF family extracellular repeat protein